jgi:hypothetical protein
VQVLAPCPALRGMEFLARDWIYLPSAFDPSGCGSGFSPYRLVGWPATS